MKRRFPASLASLALGLAMAGTSALTGALTPGVKLAQGQAPFQLEAMIPQRFGAWQLDPSVVPLTPDPEQQGMLKKLYDQTLSRTYIDGDGRRVMLSIAYGGDQSKALQLHLPEVCYVAQGFQLVRDGSGSLATRYGALPVKRLVARQQGRNEPITYWITIGDKATRSGIEQKLRRLAYGLSGEIPDGMLVRVSSITTDESAAYALQDRFVADMLASLDAASRARLIGAGAASPEAGKARAQASPPAVPGPQQPAVQQPAVQQPAVQQPAVQQQAVYRKTPAPQTTQHAERKPMHDAERITQ